MMTFTELKKRFKNKDMFPLKPWNNVTDTPEGKPVGGDCEDWGWSAWVAEAGGVGKALVSTSTSVTTPAISVSPTVMLYAGPGPNDGPIWVMRIGFTTRPPSHR